MQLNQLHTNQQNELFIATLSHDLKNPLIAQMKILDLISKGSFGEINAELKEMMNLMINSTKYMQDMLYSLLSMYKIKNAKVRLDIKLTNINNIVLSAIDDMKSLGFEKGVNIKYNSSIKQEIEFDTLQIKRVIVNILTNALSYAFKNTDIIINTKIKNGFFVFECQNESPKIDEKLKSKIFEKFTSSSSLGGLGMYISKQIIKAHKGNIYCSSNDNKTIFGFEIPTDLKNNELCIVWE